MNSQPTTWRVDNLSTSLSRHTLAIPVYQTKVLHNTPNWIHKIGVRTIAANKHITLQPIYEANLEQHNATSEILTTDIPYSQILYNIYIPAMHLAPIEHNIRRLIRHLQNAQAVAK